MHFSSQHAHSYTKRLFGILSKATSIHAKISFTNNLRFILSQVYLIDRVVIALRGPSEGLSFQRSQFYLSLSQKASNRILARWTGRRKALARECLTSAYFYPSEGSLLAAMVSMPLRVHCRQFLLVSWYISSWCKPKRYAHLASNQSANGFQSSFSLISPSDQRSNSQAIYRAGYYP